MAAVVAALAAFVNTGQAQVTLSQVTNGLVSWYPLDFVVTNGATISTFDYVSARDMTLFNLNGTHVIASTRPSGDPTTVSNCLNFDQQASGVGNTIMYYQSKGQGGLPLNGSGSGDFLPFCNQINATMSFWIKCTANTGVNAYNDKRFFGEADDGNGVNAPLFLFGTSSGGGLPTDRQAHFLFRQDTSGSPTTSMVDGTFQTPNFNILWGQGGSFTSNSLLDGNWHLYTMTIDSNRVIDIFIDGVRDPGPPGPTFTDLYGNPTYGPAVPMTNEFYTTNIYPAAGVSNPPPNGFVRWVFNGMFTKGVTAFGGFRRNGGNTGGFPMLYDDIGFWNRRLTLEEIEFVYTNGIKDIPIVRPLSINSFAADFPQIGLGDSVRLSWNLTGANTNAGGIVISGVGDVSGMGQVGSTNVTLTGSQQTFTMIAQGLGGPKTNSVTVTTFAGVSSQWHLVERLDGTYANTEGGINTNNWISAGSDFSGSFDKWNVQTITNSGGENKVLTPRTGYNPNVNAASGFESRGALAYARLGGLTMSPGQSNTLFFRFSLRETETYSPGVFSDIDFGIGLSDYNFIGPSAGLGFYGGTGGGLGPYMSILRATTFAGGPFDLFAPDTADASDTNTAAQFSYVASVDPNGLQTNVNYMVWMDVINRNTHAEPDGLGGTNTVQQALYSVWLQRQGDPNRVLLFTNFHGNRNYVGFNPVNDTPVPFLDRVFLNIGSESLAGGAAGSYITTNMIAVDDIYMSKTGFASTVPRLFDLTSIVRGPTSVTITWNSLGSLHGTNTYSVQRKLGSLNDPTWTTVAAGLPSGGATTTYIDSSVGANDAAFYRIVWP
jgi:hypothetical protein